ncbi:hypothetical protein ACFDR9_004626 [Janthinobacterium sp. CG_23.3]|uniref:hypothetical protein n=1 Tax=Janthinobacterium sp. CG_23.3 TaxID=3349634 RepID=UPI0038D4798A
MQLRRNLDGAGAPLAAGAARRLETEAAVGGASLGEFMLNKEQDVLGAALFRKADAGPAYGVFMKREYAALPAVAACLSVLSHKDCVYLPEALSSRCAPAGGEAGVEWLQLFCDARQGGAFLRERAASHEQLAMKLSSRLVYLASMHQQVKAGACALEKIHAVVRQATTALLTE